MGDLRLDGQSEWIVNNPGAAEPKGWRMEGNHGTDPSVYSWWPLTLSCQVWRESLHTVIKLKETKPGVNDIWGATNRGD